MAVKTLPMMSSKATTATASPLSSNNPSMNKRWPPMADKSSLPYKLTTLSKQKLAREATAPDPDIRRCLGHFRLHCMSMEWAQRDMTTRINSIELESESESESEESESDDTMTHGSKTDEPGDNTSDKDSNSSSEEDEEKNSRRPEVAPTPVDQQEKDKETLQVRFEVSFEQTPTPVSPEEKEKEGLLEKGRNCLEKTVQRTNFWPSPGQCMPVRI